MKIDDIVLLKCLGSGTFGEVYLSTKEGSREYYATKKLNRQEMDEPLKKKYLQNEIQILKELDHPNIYKLKDIKMTKHNYFLVMEYINGGCLSDCLEKYQQKFKASFSEEIVQYLMRQIIDAFKYIHAKKIMHRDIKLENIMVNFSNENDKKNLNLLKAQVKIIDFGLAMKGSMGKTVLGSPLTMDPKIIEKYANSPASKISKEEVYDQKVDIWSLGSVCYNMLIGKEVFDASTLNELVQKVEEGSYSVPTSISREIVSFLNSMLQYKSEKRLSAAELANHPFLTKNVKDFKKIDTKKVSKKIGKNGLNINIKNNQTIWSIFNEEDEKKLLNINKEKAHGLPKRSNSFPIQENPYISGSGNIYSQISNNSNMTNTHFTPNVASYHQMPNTGGVSGGFISFYGQKMSADNNVNMPNIQNNANNINMQNMQNQQVFHSRTLPINYNINGMNNFSNFNQNSQGLGSQITSPNGLGFNNNYNNNQLNKNISRPIDNDDSDDVKEKVCYIM